MPVYLCDKDAREEFIKEVITTTGYDASDFVAYVYMEGQGLYSEENYACYKKVIDSVAEKFPNIELGILVEEIAKAMREEEDQYIEAWMGQFSGVVKEMISSAQQDEDGHYYR